MGKQLPLVIQALNDQETRLIWIKTERCYKNVIRQAESSRAGLSFCRKEREKNCGKRAR